LSAFFGRPIRLLRCNSCGLAFKEITTTAEAERQLYSGWKAQGQDVYLPSQPDGISYVKSLIDKHLNQNFQTSSALSVLDVGVGEGYFIQMFSRHQTYGIELERMPGLDYEKMLNGQLIVGQLETLDLTPYKGFFHLVTVFDVFEHFLDARAAMANLGKVLRPGGLLAIETGDMDSFAARLWGRNRWWYVILPVHKLFWNKASLKKALAAEGMEVIHFERKAHKDGTKFSYKHLLAHVFKKTLYLISSKAYFALMRRLGKTERLPELARFPWKDHLFAIARKSK